MGIVLVAIGVFAKSVVISLVSALLGLVMIYFGSLGYKRRLKQGQDDKGDSS